MCQRASAAVAVVLVNVGDARLEWTREQPFADALASLPGAESLDDPGAAAFLDGMTSRQHPERDTDAWPPDA